MLQVISALNGYSIEASDGRIGAVSDFLFDDRTWKVRWLVDDAGTWLTERKVLLHPSAIERTDYEGQSFAVALTKAQVEASPSILEHQPVSLQMERELYSYYDWDPLWGGGVFAGNAGAMAAPLSAPPFFSAASMEGAVEMDPAAHEQDPHLHSTVEVAGYRIHASDGDIGHIENMVIESADWGLRYLVVDTSNWWLGQHVLMSPHAVKEIDWSERHVQLTVTRAQVKASPPWDPLALMDQAYMKHLHGHYGWPGSGD
jgi:hypothetical protein